MHRMQHCSASSVPKSPKLHAASWRETAARCGSQGISASCYPNAVSLSCATSYPQGCLCHTAWRDGESLLAHSRAVAAPGLGIAPKIDV